MIARTDFKSQRCLVTGGAGFIGCAISTQLANAFGEVIAMDSLHPQIHAEPVRPAALDPRVQFFRGDVTCQDDWATVLENGLPNVVIHLAAETGTGQSLHESTRHAAVNVVGTTQMLDAFSTRSHCPDTLVLTSSRAVYGEGRWQSPATGEIVYPGQRDRAQLEAGQWDFPGLQPLPFEAAANHPAPSNVYAATKLAQEHLMSAWAQAFGASLRVLRLQNVYGAGQSLSNPYTGIVSLFVRMAKAGRSIPLYEDGKMTRDFVYISDVANAIVAAAMATEGKLLADIGLGEAATIEQVAKYIAARYGAPAPQVCGKYRHGDVRHAACSIENTLRTLRWTPQVSLEQGLEALCEWIDQQPSLPAL